MLQTARRKKAAALGYNAQADQAPEILAAGAGLIAEKILEIARLHDIPIHEDPNLADLLAGLEIGEHVPPELYKLVAAVLAFIYDLDKMYGLVKKK